MLLNDLLESIGPIGLTGPVDREVSSIVYDSRRAKPGALFVALEGAVSDGRRFIADAAARGAVAVMGRGLADVAESLTRIEVEDPRRSMARAAARLAGRPSEQLALVGVTGTNGKTTTAYLLRAIWEEAGLPAGLIGTIEYATGRRSIRAARTTPESPDIQSYLREMLDDEIRMAVMEVSSHGLAQGRVEGCSFAAALFTRITRDHLDFHGSTQAYLEAKLQLIEHVRGGGVLVLNRDDEATYRTVMERAAGRRVISYGAREDALLRGAEVTCSLDGIRMEFLWKGERFPLRSSLIGAFNAENILAAVGGALATGVEPAIAARGVERLRGVPGRFQRVDDGAPFAVIVDYAHTDDALEKLLAAVRSLTAGKIICVFGCGGDRDATKRAPMGGAADRWSDLPIVTTDNPRSEDPERIFSQIMSGMRSDRARVIEDRAEAIAAAIRSAEPGDAVVIAGKGHETEQEIRGETHHFSDTEVARDVLRQRFGSTGERTG